MEVELLNLQYCAEYKYEYNTIQFLNFATLDIIKTIIQQIQWYFDQRIFMSFSIYSPGGNTTVVVLFL